MTFIYSIETDLDKSNEHDHKNIEHGLDIECDLDTDTEPDDTTLENMTKIQTLNVT